MAKHDDKQKCCVVTRNSKNLKDAPAYYQKEVNAAYLDKWQMTKGVGKD